MRREHARDAGFSLVELMVVIVIIGILAAIAIPALLRHQRSAYDASVREDLHNVAVAVTAAAADDVTLGPGALGTDVSLSPGNLIEVRGTGDSWCLRGRHEGTVDSQEWVFADGRIDLAAASSCDTAVLLSLP